MYSIYDAAQQAIHYLNLAIVQLEEKQDVIEGRNYMQSIINILSSMNEYYEENYIIGVEAGGSKRCQPSRAGSSACYNYLRNRRNIVKLEECKRLLNDYNPDMRFVIEILKLQLDFSE